MALHAGGAVKAAAGTAFVDGISTGLLCAAAALLAAITVLLLLPRQRRSRHPASGDQPAPAPATR